MCSLNWRNWSKISGSWDNCPVSSHLPVPPNQVPLPPNSAKGFWAEWFSIKGGGYLQQFFGTIFNFVWYSQLSPSITNYKLIVMGDKFRSSCKISFNKIQHCFESFSSLFSLFLKNLIFLFSLFLFIMKSIKEQDMPFTTIQYSSICSFDHLIGSF